MMLKGDSHRLLTGVLQEVLMDLNAFLFLLEFEEKLVFVSLLKWLCLCFKMVLEHVISILLCGPLYSTVNILEVR